MSTSRPAKRNYKNLTEASEAYDKLLKRQRDIAQEENLKTAFEALERDIAEFREGMQEIQEYKTQTQAQKNSLLHKLDLDKYYFYLNYMRAQSAKALNKINTCPREDLLDYQSWESVSEFIRIRDSNYYVTVTNNYGERVNLYVSNECAEEQSKIDNQVIDKWNSTDPVLTPKKRWLGALSGSSIALTILAGLGVLALLAFAPPAGLAAISTGYLILGAVLGGPIATASLIPGIKEGYYTGAGFMPALRGVGKAIGIALTFPFFCILAACGAGAACNIGNSDDENINIKYRNFLDARSKLNRERETAAASKDTPNTTRMLQQQLGTPVASVSAAEVSQAPAAAVQAEVSQDRVAEPQVEHTAVSLSM